MELAKAAARDIAGRVEKACTGATGSARAAEIALEPTSDLAAASRGALGADWERLSVQQRDRFSHAFKRLMRARYLGRLKRCGPLQLLVGEASPRGAAVIVRARLEHAEGSADELGLVLADSGDGPRIVDVYLGDVSVMRNYRSSFRKSIRTRGFDGLMEDLERAIAKATPDDR
ncbi:MAG: ABC transporter substrate-binding protein [Deltaproteobacteria bacterium]|nr:ABC transporter substrate-binding protein [Deltaproteobacteria bacterium]